MPQPEEIIRCRDECGATVPADQVQGTGWEYLPIQRRYRCTACWRLLNLINAQLEGPDHD